MSDRRIYSQSIATPTFTEPEFQSVEDQVGYLLARRAEKDDLIQRLRELEESIEYHENQVRARLEKIENEAFLVPMKSAR